MGKTYQALRRAEKEYRKNISTMPPGNPSDTSNEILLKPQAPVLLPDQSSRLPVIMPDNGSSDQYETLKSNILSRFPAEKIKTLVFTSTSYGDGTSTTAANFASALARDTWRSILVVDADIRRPCLHKVFNTEITNGLSDFLSDEKIREPEHRKLENNFYFQTSGLLGARAVGLFETAKFDEFLELASQRFDHVIIDCPPVTKFPETRVIAGKVNGVIMVLNSGKTKIEVALRVKNDLQESGANILGTVLNRRKFFIPNWLYKKL